MMLWARGVWPTEDGKKTGCYLLVSGSKSGPWLLAQVKNGTVMKKLDRHRLCLINF
jgi:hypothetical protein